MLEHAYELPKDAFELARGGRFVVQVAEEDRPVSCEGKTEGFVGPQAFIAHSGCREIEWNPHGVAQVSSSSHDCTEWPEVMEATGWAKQGPGDP